MNKKHKQLFALGLMLCSTFTSIQAQKQWTLQECLNYALENNIQIKQNKISALSNEVEVKSSKAALFPSLSFSTNQSGSWRPYSLSTVSLTNGTMTTSQSTTSYNGSYGLNANWTVWNGGKNTKNIKKSKYTLQESELEAQETANSIQEQIAQLYIQILYETEAVKVNEEMIKASKLQRDRAQEMVNVKLLTKVDLAQLEAQVTQDEYSLVNVQSQLANYKLQLKQLLEIHDENDFEVALPQVSDNSVLASIPSKTSVYQASLHSRPEILRNQLSIESSNLDVAIAKAGKLPTISLTAGIGSNNSSGNKGVNFGQQLKNNWSNTIGLTISVPILDQRSTKSAVEKAKLSVESNKLSLENAQKKLYSDIETYWLNATTAQQQYRYAKTNTESMEKSYDLVSEQFRLGLKNIVELTTGKNNLLSAKQQMIQAKYTSLYNLAMLKFYSGESIKL